MLRFLKRNLTTAMKLPVAAAWDAVSMCNVAQGSSTMKVIEEHQRKAERDETLDLIEDIADTLRNK